MTKELMHFFGGNLLQSKIHSQSGSLQIVTLRDSLYSIVDIQSCIKKVSDNLQYVYLQ